MNIESPEAIREKAKQVADAMAESDYTLVNILLQGYSYYFKKEVEKLLPPINLRVYETICP